MEMKLKTLRQATHNLQGVFEQGTFIPNCMTVEQRFWPQLRKHQDKRHAERLKIRIPLCTSEGRKTCALFCLPISWLAKIVTNISFDLFFLIHTFALLTGYNFDRTNLLAGGAENNKLLGQWTLLNKQAILKQPSKN